MTEHEARPTLVDEVRRRPCARAFGHLATVEEQRRAGLVDAVADEVSACQDWHGQAASLLGPVGAQQHPARVVLLDAQRDSLVVAIAADVDDVAVGVDAVPVEAHVELEAARVRAKHAHVGAKLDVATQVHQRARRRVTEAAGLAIEPRGRLDDGRVDARALLARAGSARDPAGSAVRRRGRQIGLAAVCGVAVAVSSRVLARAHFAQTIGAADRRCPRERAR